MKVFQVRRLDEVFKHVRVTVDLPPILGQMVKTHFSLNGELSHGIGT
jgi:hypothetical protein